MHEHAYYEKLIDRLLDGDLTEPEQAELREHLRACQECARTLTALTDMTVALRQAQAEPPAALARGVMASIAAAQAADIAQSPEADTAETEAEAPKTPPAPAEEPEPETETEPLSMPAGPAHHARPRRGRRPVWLAYGAAACLALAVAGGAFVLLRGGRKSGGSDEAAQAPMAAAYDMLEEEAAVEMADAGEGAEVTEEAPAAGEGGLADGAADTAAAESKAGAPQALEVLDVAGNPVGSVAPDNIAALAALLTDKGWGRAGMPDTDWNVLYQVRYAGVDYVLGTDEAGETLVWWEESVGQPRRSPGSPDELRQLIDFTAPLWPQ